MDYLTLGLYRKSHTRVEDVEYVEGLEELEEVGEEEEEFMMMFPLSHSP